MKPLRRNHRAIALIVTLVSLVIATILIVAFVTTMRTERRAANAVANDERSKLIAQSAIQHAMALLSKNIPQPVPLGYVSGTGSPVTGITATGSAPVNWMVNPGLLTLYTGPDGSPPQYVPLFTSTNAATSPLTVPSGDVVNLNSPLLTNATAYPIIPTGDPVPAGWIYVPQDPTAVASATNPIIGRYAFWMDDENNKININTAYGKPPTIQNTIPGDSNNYMVRSNPLDSSTNNGYLWYPTTSSTGISTYQPEVGFNSLAASSTSAEIYPGDSADPASSKEANAVGNPKTTGLFPGPRYYPIWHPSAINLDILPTSLTNSAAIGVTDLLTTSGTALNRMSLADWVFNSYLTSGVPSTLQNTARWRLFQSPDQIEQFITTGTAAAAAFYQANEFNLTAYNRAPEFNAFGKPRLFMESRINSMEDTTSTAQFADTCVGNLSGSELEFCQTPDLDPMGPTYFHGYENMAPYTGSTSYYPDLDSVQMVADYLSSLFARSDWPGMPATSFVSKWGGNANSPIPTDDIGRREADQVAWNIVAMGNYASNQEGMTPNNIEWPDDYYNTFKRNAGASLVDSGTNINPNRTLLTNQLITAAGTDPNLSLRVGKLSGKAIMPYSPKPYVNEIALQVNAVPVSSSTSPGIYYLQLGLQVELYIPRRGPPGSFWGHLNTIEFLTTHFFYTATGTNDKGTVVTCIQGATGAPSYGNGGSLETYYNSGGVLVNYGATFKGKNSAGSGGSTTYPWAGCLNGKFSSSSTYLPVDSYQTVLSNTTTDPFVSTSTSMLYETGTSVPAGAQKFTGVVNVQARLRLALYDNTQDNTWEIVPVWDTVDTSASALIRRPAKITRTLSHGTSTSTSTHHGLAVRLKAPFFGAS